VKGTVQVTGLRKLTRLVGEWEARGEALKKQFMYRVVSWAHHSLLDNIPKEYETLRDSLRIGRITGTPRMEPAYVIEAVARSKSLGELDSGNVLLYVQAKPHQMRAIPAEVQVLIDHGPWTIGTLPLHPNPRIAVVVSRTVGARSVQRVENARRRDRRIWKRKLERQGVRVRSTGQQLQTNRQVRALPDVALESAKLEFGLGGVASHPHWRPTIVRLASRQGAGIIARRREFVKVMTSAGFGAWKNWPRKVPRRVRLSTARKFMPFQKRLGVRIPR
jgi:hypothetical protein